MNTVDAEGNGWFSQGDSAPLFTFSLFVNYGGERVRLASVPV